MADIFHTFFGIAGLSLLKYFNRFPDKYNAFKPIDSTFALPVEVVERLGLQPEKIPDLKL